METDIDINDLKSFLEKQFFSDQPIELKKINRGGNSLNYFAQTDNKAYIIKLISKEDKPHYRRLEKIFNFFPKFADFYTAHPAQIKKQNCFYKQYKVFIINFIQGKKLKFYELTPSCVPLIADNYRQFCKIDFSTADFILPARIPEDLYKQNKEQLESYLTGQSAYKRHIAKQFLHYNELFFNSVPSIKTQDSIIHGDASLANMLLDKQNRIAFLDLELIRFGKRTEDIAELFLSALLPHYIFLTPQKKLLSLIRAANTETEFTAREWQYGICMHFLFFICRRLRGGKLFKSLRKDWLALRYLRKFETIIKLLPRI